FPIVALYIVAPRRLGALHPSARFARMRLLALQESDRMNAIRRGTYRVRNQFDPDAASMCCMLASRLAHNTSRAMNSFQSQLMMYYFVRQRALRERAASSAANTAGGPNHNEKGLLVMADLNLTLTVTMDEIRTLADRLEARGTSVLMRDQPAQCADLERAAHLLRFLAGSCALPPAGRLSL